MSSAFEKLVEQAKTFPQSPGVYFFRGARREVLYIGKATNLRSRVASYFTGRDSRGKRIFQMVEQARSVEFQQTDTVLEAVILEANLIRKYKPKYNVEFKDDKTFSYIIVTKEEFPKVLMLRETQLLKGTNNEKSPLIPLLKKGEEISLPFAKGVPEGRGIHRIYGPYPSKKQATIVLNILRKIFPFHASKQKTEKGCLDFQIGLCPGPYADAISPQEYKKNIRSIEMVLRGKKRQLLVQLMRDMKKLAREEKFEEAEHVKKKIFALEHIRDIALLTRNTERRSRNLDQGNHPLTPSHGGGTEHSLWEEKSLRIEGYDISNISGKYAVGSMVVSEGGEMNPSEYRKFRIRSVEGSDDYAMMREVITRRLNHNEWKSPDLLLLDGGKGHLQAIEKLFEDLGVSFPLASMAKGPERKRSDLFISEKFPPKTQDVLDQEILEEVRNEAHRFAITYHRKLRGREFLGR